MLLLKIFIITFTLGFSIVGILVVWVKTSFNPLNLFSTKVDKQVFKQIINIIKWGFTMPLNNWESRSESVYLYNLNDEDTDYYGTPKHPIIIELGAYSNVNGVNMPFNLSQTLVFYYYYKKSKRYVRNQRKKELRDRALDKVIENCQSIPILEGSELPTGQLSITKCQTVKEVI